jgi:hypothetical protein
VIDVLKGLEARRSAAVRRAGERLTLPAINLLFEVIMHGTVTHPATRTMVQVLAAVQRSQAIALLLDLGAIRANVLRMTPELLGDLAKQNSTEPELLSYRPTPFGQALLEYCGEEMGVLEPSLRPALEALFATDSSDGAA